MSGDTLNGKVVIITGAAGGFGRVLVRALLDEGANVAVLDINEIGLAGLKGSLPAEAAHRLSTRVTDISDCGACDAAVPPIRRWCRRNRASIART